MVNLPDIEGSPSAPAVHRPSLDGRRAGMGLPSADAVPAPARDSATFLSGLRTGHNSRHHRPHGL